MRAIRTRVKARDIGEDHRVASPLELLFDLTFVVAVGSLVAQLAHAIVDGHAAEAVGPFLMVFFAIWWAWNQFTWLASAYDNDDVPYRVFTLVQMAGVLVLAAGVPAAFSAQDFGAITLGYLVMRLGLLGMLTRAAIEDPESRPNSLRYVIGISVVQVGWLSRLFLVPVEFLLLAFLLLAALELLVSPWADRAGRLSWHPHHIAERYGLFAIILLGESVLAVTIAVQESLADGVSASLIIAAISGLVLLFTLWWLYFSEPAAEGLVKRRNRSYIWGYGHYGIYASLAAIGAGLEVVVKVVTQHSEAGDLVAGYALAIPLAVYLLLLWLLHAPMVDRVSIPPVATVVSVVVVLAAPLASVWIGVLGVTVLMTCVTVILLVVALVSARE
ncbi:MAG: low temperature requirement protein A [Salinibacterium sp.]|nr:low temperature requirement protein A [Salinibacterium sp.]